MAIRKIDIRLRLLPKPLMTRMLRLGDGRSLGGIIPRGKICVLPYVCNPRSAIYNPQSEKGGIAQLVERQLCKLEVRGSNPLASSLRSQRGGERRLSRMFTFCKVRPIQGGFTPAARAIFEGD